MRIVTWTLSNLCSGEIPPPGLADIRKILPILGKLIHHNDKEIQADACWALTHLTGGPNERIQEVVDAGVVPRLVNLLESPKVIFIQFKIFG